MNKTSNRWQGRLKTGMASALAAGLVAACGGGSGTDATDAATAAAPSTRDATALGRKSSGSSQPAAQPANTEGRLLASNCFQCHGTLGTGGFDGIRGKEADEVLEFLRKPAARDIMAAHAQGYTPAQLQKIVAYLQQ